MQTIRASARALRQPIRLPSPLRHLSSSARSLQPTPSSARRSDTVLSPPPPQEPPLTDGEKELKSKLEKELVGAKVIVADVSGGCGTFYAISIAHSSFKGLSTIKQHRLVNGLLKEEIKDMHGLQLKTSVE